MKSDFLSIREEKEGKMVYISRNWTMALRNLPLSIRSLQLNKLDEAVKELNNKKPKKGDLLTVGKKFDAWLKANVSPQEIDAVKNAVKHLPEPLTQDRNNKLNIKAKIQSKCPYEKGISSIRVKRKLTEEMKSNGKTDTYKWVVNFTLRPSDISDVVWVEVPICAEDGRGKKMPSTNIIGAELDENVKRLWSTTITKIWMGATFVHEKNEQVLRKMDIKFKIVWVDDPKGASTVISVRRSRKTVDQDVRVEGTVDTVYWGADDGKIHEGHETCSVAHEFGHLIGNPDEYNTVTFLGKTVTNNGGIMQEQEADTAKAGHFYLIGSQLAYYYGYNPAECFIIFRTKSYKVSNNHPWK